jgi:PPM family protein phosphatase
MNITYSARTDVGKARVLNEDNYLIVPEMSKGHKFFEENKEYFLTDDFSLIIVADGMGGASAGEIAAKTAVETIYEVLKEQTQLDNRNWFEIFKLAFEEVNNLLQAYSEKHPESKGLGTTCICACLYKGKAYVSWIGDSRAYLWNDKNGLKKLSKDHSLVQDLVDKKIITEDQAFDHPNKNVITQSLDDSGSELRPGEVIIELSKEDYLLMCSDGLSGMINDKQIESIFYAEYQDQSKLMNSLVNAALEAGGLDNITLLSAKIEGLASAMIPSVETKKDFKTLFFASLIFGLVVTAFLLFYIFKSQSIPAEEDLGIINKDHPALDSSKSTNDNDKSWGKKFMDSTMAKDSVPSLKDKDSVINSMDTLTKVKMKVVDPSPSSMDSLR